MARFYVTSQGSRGECSRMGTPQSGIYSHPRGWNVGVLVRGEVEDGEDVFHITATGGSTGSASSTYLGTVRLDDEGNPVFIPAMVAA